MTDDVATSTGPPGRGRCRRTVLVLVAANFAVLSLMLVGHHGGGLGAGALLSPLYGRPAPPIAGTSTDGRRVGLDDYRGRWVIVNFFATWCPGCRAETPELARFVGEHQPDGDVAVLGVVHGDSLDASRQYLRDRNADWVLLGDPDDRIAEGYLVDGIPDSFLIAPDGTVVAGVQGGVRAAQLDEMLAAAKRDGASTGPGGPATSTQRSAGVAQPAGLAAATSE